MVFRRHDIPKTTRTSDNGLPRLYPRFLRDASLLPKIDLAVEYLESMLGRRRGDLSPDLLLELFGDPKLARCLLASMDNHYRYRTTEMSEVIGAGAAAALLTWEIATPADLRAHLYLAANASRGGFVPDENRAAFFAESAQALGVSVDQLNELIHLDAERNAVLVRVGPKPEGRDVLARYNALLCLSVLRHASAIELELPGLDGAAIVAVCARHEVEARLPGDGRAWLAGRRGAAGTWAGFGMRLARCAIQLLILAPKTPSGEAKIHFGERAYRFKLDAKAVGALRPKLRAAAGPEGIAAATDFADRWSAMRRESPDLDGWRLRRWPEPLAVDGCVVLPELVFTRDYAVVPVLPIPDRHGSKESLAALEAVRGVAPIIATGASDAADGLPAIEGGDSRELAELLERLNPAPQSISQVERRLEEEFGQRGWLIDAELGEIEQSAIADSLVGRLKRAGAITVEGFGLCRPELLATLRAELRGPVDIAAVRRAVAARVGAASGADALTLHLLTERGVIAALPHPAESSLAA